MTPQGFWRKFGHLPSSPGFSTVRLYVTDLIFRFLFQSWSALSFGASKIGGKVAEVGWKFTEVASQKVSEVSGVVSDKVSTLKTLVCFRNGNTTSKLQVLITWEKFLELSGIVSHIVKRSWLTNKVLLLHSKKVSDSEVSGVTSC